MEDLYNGEMEIMNDLIDHVEIISNNTKKVFYRISIDNKIVYETSNGDTPTEDELVLINNAEEEYLISMTENSLNNLCDTKSKEAKNYINGSEVSSEQLERYKEKEEIALSSDKSSLQLEADLQGITVDELATLIIDKANDYRLALKLFNTRIEAFRIAVSKVISSGDLEKANAIIEKAKYFDANTSDGDIKALFV